MSQPSPRLDDYFRHDHRHCDACWADVERAVQAGQAEDIAAAWRRFDRAQRLHLQREEEVLFPAFEQVSGMPPGAGPTAVMRSEHEQMRGLLEQMAAAAGDGRFQELLDQGDTLLMLVQQHNQKEENVLYPMAAEVLAERWEELRARAEALGA